MKKIVNVNKIVLLFIFSVALLGCSIHSREEAFTEEEIISYSKENYAIGDIEFIEDYYGDNVSEVNWMYHYFKFKEINERGLEFLVIDVKHYDGKLTSSYYYDTNTDFEQKVLLDYVNKNDLPSGDYLSNTEGGYSFSMSEGLEKPYKIVVPYSGEKDFNNKLDSIYEYVTKMNDYNKKVTGTKNDLYVYLLFVDENDDDFDVRIYNKDISENSECSYKNFKKCVSKTKKQHDSYNK